MQRSERDSEHNEREVDKQQYIYIYRPMMPPWPQVMILPPGNLDMTLRHILDHSHSDLQISRMSSWRFAWPVGVDPYITTYPYHDDIVRDLQDDRSGQKRPFGPKELETSFFPSWGFGELVLCEGCNEYRERSANSGHGGIMD